MRNKLWAFLVLLLMGLPMWAGDSTKTIRPQFIATSFTEGLLLPSRYLSPGKKYESPSYSALTLKYALAAKGDRWEDYVYGMPYKGVGVYLPRFSNRDALGDPFSVFLFQGGRMKQFSPTFSLNYEINLGASFNWNHYDMYTRPWLIAVGASTNVHIGGNWYLQWKLSQKLDLRVGAAITHFSNGALRTPNNGINAMSAFVEMAYHLQRTEEKKILTDGVYTPPKFEKNKAHDLTFMLTTRTIKIDTLGTELFSKYPRRHFKVAGINYSYMWHNTRRFMWGPSIETVYDESVNADVAGEWDSDTRKYTEHITLGNVSDRFSVGVSLRGEYAMPGYSIFTHLGYDIRHKDTRDRSLYQIYGLKVYLIDNLFGTFGVRSTNLTRSRYLYLNIGYTFRQYKKSR